MTDLSHPTSEKWLVIGSANGSGNLGDEAMWQAAVQQLRKHVGDVEIITDGQLDWDCGGLARVKIRPYLYFSLMRFGAWQQSGSRLVRLAAKVLARPRRMQFALDAYEAARSAPKGSLQTEWYSTIGEVSGVLFSGAGAMTSRYAVNGILTWALIAEWANKQGVPVCFLGQGVGPFDDSTLESVARRALEFADIVGVREASSFELVKSWGLEERARLASDWATLAVPSDDDRAHAQLLHEQLVDGKAFISICLHRVRGLPQASLDALVQSARAVLEFARTNDLAVVFVPNMLGDGVNDDRETAAFVLRELNLPAEPTVVSIQEPLTATETRALHARAQFTVSTRYHTLVFAGSEGKHTVGLAIDQYWRQKLEGTQINSQQQPRVVSSDGANGTFDVDALKEMLEVSLVESATPLPGIQGISAAETLEEFLVGARR